jgi:hypothetical protein
MASANFNEAAIFEGGFFYQTSSMVLSISANVSLPLLCENGILEKHMLNKLN